MVNLFYAGFEWRCPSKMKETQTYKEKVTTISAMILFIVFALYEVSVIVLNPENGMGFKVLLSFAAITIFSVILCFSIRCKIHIYSSLLHQLDQQKKLTQIPSNNFLKTFYKTILFFILCLPFGIGAVMTGDYYHEDTPMERFSFGYNFKNPNMKYVIVYIYFFADTVMTLSYPCFCAISICDVLSDCSANIIQYHTIVKDLHCTSKVINRVDLIEFYLDTINIIQKIVEHLSLPLLIIIVSVILNLFSILSLSLIYSLNLYLTIANVLSLAIVTVTLLSLNICCSKIVDNQLEIKRAAGLWIYNYGYRGIINMRTLKLFQRIECKSIVYVSVGHFVNIKRKFIFSIFGFLCTYGLLLINIKM